MLSHLAAVAAAGVALHVVSREAMGLKSWAPRQCFDGVRDRGDALHGDARHPAAGGDASRPHEVALSVIIAVVVAMVALRLQFASKRGEGVIKLRSALLMGLAIPGLHYTAMAGLVLPARAYWAIRAMR